MSTLGERIKIARTALTPKVTQKQIAEHFGIERVNVTQWEGDTTRPDGYRIPELAKLLQVSEEWLREGSGAGPTQSAARPSVSRSKPTTPPVIIPGQELVAQNGESLPVYAAARGGEGHILVTFDEIERVKMPTVLQGVKGGYGLLVAGDSMVPVYHPGDTLLVHPHLQPARGYNHVFYHRPPHGGEEEAVVKELVAFNDREWTLKQWNPVNEWKENRQVWQTCHRIVGKYDRR
jgi:phage repressor protein C with HTH and peptisase S24 domain